MRHWNKQCALRSHGCLASGLNASRLLHPLDVEIASARTDLFHLSTSGTTHVKMMLHLPSLELSVDPKFLTPVCRKHAMRGPCHGVLWNARARSEHTRDKMFVAEVRRSAVCEDLDVVRRVQCRRLH